MKFKKYINESLDINVAIKFIEKNCKPYLRDWKSSNTWQDEMALYSGRKRSTDPTIKNVRKDRRPLDTDYNIHDELNDFFNKKFKIPLRSESIFATSNSHLASEFGDKNFIFPIGKYELYWNHSIEDLTKDIKDEADGDNWIITKEYYKTLNKYKKGDLRGAIKSGNEVMIHTNKVIFVPFKYIEEVYQMIEIF